MPTFCRMAPLEAAGASCCRWPAIAGLAQTAPLRIVALGASNTAGWGVAASESYPAQLEALLAAKGMPASVANAGVPGDTSGAMLARLDREVPPGTHLVILQPGTNDERYSSAARMRTTNIAEIGRRLDGRGIKLVIIEKRVCWPNCRRASCARMAFTIRPRGYTLLAQRLRRVIIDALNKR